MGHRASNDLLVKQPYFGGVAPHFLQQGAVSEGGVGARAHRCVIVFDDVTFKPGLGVPLVLESQKLVVAQQVIASDRLGDGL